MCACKAFASIELAAEGAWLLMPANSATKADETQ
jgi:hypothetical protein